MKLDNIIIDKLILYSLTRKNFFLLIPQKYEWGHMSSLFILIMLNCIRNHSKHLFKPLFLLLIWGLRIAGCLESKNKSLDDITNSFIIASLQRLTIYRNRTFQFSTLGSSKVKIAFLERTFDWTKLFSRTSKQFNLPFLWDKSMTSTFMCKLKKKNVCGFYLHEIYLVTSYNGKKFEENKFVELWVKN